MTTQKTLDAEIADALEEWEVEKFLKRHVVIKSEDPLTKLIDWLKHQ